MKLIRFKSEYFGTVDVNLTEAIAGRPELITEDLSDSDVNKIKKIIDSQLQSGINGEMSKAVKKEIGSKATEEMIVTITTNCLIQLYKALWSRRGFWKSAISNKAN